MSRSKASIYQLKISLRHSKPPIWRRILVSSTITLAELHEIIQITMGWWNAHLHQFVINGRYFSPPMDDFFSFNDPFNSRETKDTLKVRLNQVVTDEGFKFDYEYDFGDGWEHIILVEKVLPFDPSQQLPVCIKGKRACPPEDVGGIWGYYMFLEAINDPQHPDHDMLLEWIGGTFDAEAFDIEQVNGMLQ